MGLACGQCGTLIHTIDTNAPWLNARTEMSERSHAILRDQVLLALESVSRCVTPINNDEFLTLVYHSVSMQNHHCSRGGYSPVQRVLSYQSKEPRPGVAVAEWT
eukprot:3583387-Amphidinium_carterae.2